VRVEPVDDGIKTRRSAETIGVIDHPASKNTPARTACDEQIILVDVTLGENRVDAGVKSWKSLPG
jgi:hypothetical protein